MNHQTDAKPLSGNMTSEINWDMVYISELPRVYNFFLYKTGDRDFAQDLSSTTFERAWKLRSRYKASLSAVPTWLFGIARNVLKENLRKNRVYQQKLETLSRREGRLNSIDVEEGIQQKQDIERLRKAILALREREQELIALKYGAGLTNREIAKIIHLSESNVGSILHRSMKKIENMMEEDHG